MDSANQQHRSRCVAYCCVGSVYQRYCSTCDSVLAHPMVAAVRESSTLKDARVPTAEEEEKEGCNRIVVGMSCAVCTRSCYVPNLFVI